MRDKKEVLDNRVYSEILFEISSKGSYASELSNKLNKAQPVVLRQLNILKEQGYIREEDHPKNKKNIKLFFINWDKITLEFIKFLREETKNRFKLYNLIKEKKKINQRDIVIEDIYELINDSNEKRIKENTILKYSFEKIFQDYKKIGLNLTIKDIFNKFILYLSQEFYFSKHWFSNTPEEKDFNKLKESNKSLKDFENIVHICKGLTIVSTLELIFEEEGFDKKIIEELKKD